MAEEKDMARHLLRCRQIKQDFALRGISIAAWARKRGLCSQTVYDVLNGRNLGFRGESHKVAVLLGLKEGKIEQEPGAA